MNRNRAVAMVRKPELGAATAREERIATLVAEGKLLPTEKAEPFKPFKPVRVKGKPVSSLILEDRR